MRRPLRLRLLPVLLLLSSGPLHAAAVSPPGVNISWDNCFADGGTRNKNFACDVNTGTERLVLSMELAAPLDSVTGVEIRLDIHSASSLLPAWWALKNAGSCRQSSLGSSAGTAPVGSVGCVDWSGGLAVGGIGLYDTSLGGGWVRISSAVAVPGPLSLPGGQELYLQALTINHAKTVGTGACAGCDVPVCIGFVRASIIPGNNPPIYLSRGANNSASQFVTWQNGHAVNIRPGCDTPSETCRPTTFFDCVLTPTSPRGSTWGQVKALYR